MTSPLFSPVTLGAASLAQPHRRGAHVPIQRRRRLRHRLAPPASGQLGALGCRSLMVEATEVERQGRITHGCLGLYSDANEAALGRVLALLRNIGCHAKLGIQLAHAGRKGSAQLPWEGGQALKAEAGAYPTVAPSALPFDAGWHTPAQLDAAGMGRSRTPSWCCPARGAARLRRRRAHMRARLSPAGILLSARQQARGRLWRRSREPHALPARGRGRRARGVAAGAHARRPHQRQRLVGGRGTTEDAVALARS